MPNKFIAVLQKMPAFKANFVGRVTSYFALIILALGGLVLPSMGSELLAAEVKQWQTSLPEPVTPIAQMMYDFYYYWLTPVIFFVAIFVLLLLAYTCWRFSEKRNPVPSKTTHNTAIEVVWTGIPVIILLVLAFPSLSLLYASDDVSDAELTIKITGHQWYWSYEYPETDGLYYDSILLARTHAQAKEMGVNRLMDVDNPLVVPVDTKIRLLFTSADVLHNWAVSDFGVRMDTVPGRLNEAPLSPVSKTGRYYGFCSELCGVDHAYMPIVVDVVTKQEFDIWLAEKQAELAQQDKGLPNNDLQQENTLALTASPIIEAEPVKTQ